MNNHRKINIAVFVSGGGSNLQAILDAARQNFISHAQVSVVFSNRAEVYALERAKNAAVPTLVLSPKNFSNRDEYYLEVIKQLQPYAIDLICLAGFLLKLESNFIAAYRGRILNIHPSLLPKFGGPGMYGHYVHEAVLKSKEQESGCTVHEVDEFFDHGKILAQEKVPVLIEDTPETLAKRVLEKEHQLYPRVIANWIENHRVL